MQRLVTLFLAMTLFWLLSLSPQVTANHSNSGDRLNSPTLAQNRDCKGDKKDDC